MDSTVRWLIILGLLVLVVTLGLLLRRARRAKHGGELPSAPDPVGPVHELKGTVPASPPELKNTFVTAKPEQPSDGYRSIYSFISGSDRSVCPNCGVEYDRNANICSVCGNRLS